MDERKAELMNSVIEIAEMATKNVESHLILVRVPVAYSKLGGGVAELVKIPLTQLPMAPEPTRHQLSARLAYNGQTPSFLVKLQNQVAGRGTADDEDEPQYLDSIDEFGRERRPPIPERPGHDKGGSDDEDDADEKPMVVVLKEGKHLTELEAKNERRRGRPSSTSSCRYLMLA